MDRVNAEPARGIDVFLAVVQEKGFTGCGTQALQAVQEDLRRRFGQADIAGVTRVVEFGQPLTRPQMSA